MDTIVGLAVPLGAFGLLGFALHQMRRAVEASNETTRRVTASLAQVKGLQPHQADPETFPPGPAPRSWEAVERDRAKVVDMGATRAVGRRKMELTHALQRFRELGNHARVKELEKQLELLEKETA